MVANVVQPSMAALGSLWASVVSAMLALAQHGEPNRPGSGRPAQRPQQSAEPRRRRTRPARRRPEQRPRGPVRLQIVPSAATARPTGDHRDGGAGKSCPSRGPAGENSARRSDQAGATTARANPSRSLSPSEDGRPSAPVGRGQKMIVQRQNRQLNFAATDGGKAATPARAPRCPRKAPAPPAPAHCRQVAGGSPEWRPASGWWPGCR